MCQALFNHFMYYTLLIYSSQRNQEVLVFLFPLHRCCHWGSDARWAGPGMCTQVYSEAGIWTIAHTVITWVSLPLQSQRNGSKKLNKLAKFRESISLNLGIQTQLWLKVCSFHSSLLRGREKPHEWWQWAGLRAPPSQPVLSTTTRKEKEDTGKTESGIKINSLPERQTLHFKHEWFAHLCLHITTQSSMGWSSQWPGGCREKAILPQSGGPELQQDPWGEAWVLWGGRTIALTAAEKDHFSNTWLQNATSLTQTLHGLPNKCKLTHSQTLVEFSS